MSDSSDPKSHPSNVDPDPHPSAPPSPVVQFVRMRQARRYRLTLKRDGTFRCTVPPRGNLEEAQEFVQRHQAWMQQRLQVRATRTRSPSVWIPGTLVLLHGSPCPIEPTPDGRLRLGPIEFPAPPPGTTDLRPASVLALRHLAAKELPPRVVELAARHGFDPRFIQVRNQSSRWGSCSSKGRISLNWRLIQVPPDVRDYVILHELTHLRHLNHSTRFWHALSLVCPAYPEAESWLKSHGSILL